MGRTARDVEVDRDVLGYAAVRGIGAGERTTGEFGDVTNAEVHGFGRRDTCAGSRTASPAPSERRITSSGEASALASAAGDPAAVTVTSVPWSGACRWGMVRAQPQDSSAVGWAGQAYRV